MPLARRTVAAVYTCSSCTGLISACSSVSNASMVGWGVRICTDTASSLHSSIRPGPIADGPIDWQVRQPHLVPGCLARECPLHQLCVCPRMEWQRTRMSAQDSIWVMHSSSQSNIHYTAIYIAQNIQTLHRTYAQPYTHPYTHVHLLYFSEIIIGTWHNIMVQKHWEAFWNMLLLVPRIHKDSK